MSGDSRRPILIGFDGYDDATAAISGAGELLAPRKAIVAYVWESLAEVLLHSESDQLTGTMKEATEEFDASEARHAGEVCERGAELARAAGLDAHPVAAHGKPKAWPALLSLADEHDAAAIVIGSQGLGAVKSALLGSVSGGLLHHGSRPVLVVPKERRGAGAGPVVVGYDGSEHSRAGIEAAGELFAGREAVVHTVWTSYAEIVAGASLGMSAGTSAEGARKMDAELEERATKTAEEGAGLARAAGLEARAQALRSQGGVGRALQSSADELDAAVVVLGSRGRSRLSATLLGSVAAGFLNRPSLPVLVIPKKRD
jgi:nucleotide-binding universal stress UspA family protein